MRRPCLVRIISVPQLENCFHTLLFSKVTLTPFMVITGGKFFSVSEYPNVFSDNADDQDGEFDMLMTPVPALFDPSEAGDICEVVP